MSQLFFKKPYQDAIRAGRKSTTIRRWERPRVRVGQVAFSPGLGWLTIEAVEAVELEKLGEADASADGFDNVLEMRRLVLSLYPAHATDGKHWFRIRFRLKAEHRPARRSHANRSSDAEPRALLTHTASHPSLPPTIQSAPGK